MFLSIFSASELIKFLMSSRSLSFNRLYCFASCLASSLIANPWVTSSNMGSVPWVSQSGFTLYSRQMSRMVRSVIFRVPFSIFVMAPPDILILVPKARVVRLRCFLRNLSLSWISILSPLLSRIMLTHFGRGVNIKNSQVQIDKDTKG